jgi:membrane protease YdiL (CAAX protease family)
MSIEGTFTPYLRLSLPAGLERVLKALLAAVVAGFLEEIFFRGILLKGLLEDWKPAIALFVVSLFYSAIHFVKPETKVFLEGIDPWAGIRHLLTIFQPFLDPIDLLPGLLGLFFIGIALGYALIRSGSLYLSIGLHAGWIFGLKTLRVYGDFRREDLGWLFGSTDPKLVSGVATWIGIAMVALVIHRMTRRPIEP